MLKELFKMLLPEPLLNFEKQVRKNLKAREFASIIDENNISIIRRGIEIFHAQTWYEYAFVNFKHRKHAYKPYKWICSHIKPSASILESGCGIGGMLYFLNEKGYKHLYGYDIDEKSVNAGNYIKNILQIDVNLMLGDGFYPANAIYGLKFDIIIGINWIYHVPNYSIEIFFKKHISFLNENGYIIFDIIDKKYNNEENNEYCTQDWNKPKSERRKSEYILRYSKEEIEKTGKENNLQLIKFIKIKDITHHNICIMKKI
jgi:2-polyprenyl-3-methyl-5-hydroxy-6-metoxy-1,4-benzoquinol methylase